MKLIRGKQASCLAFLCAILLGVSASAQTFVRYAVPSDIGTKALYSDDVLPSVKLKWGSSDVENNPVIEEAAFELADVLRDKDMKLLRVYVCGSASPDGLWQDNVNLSRARTSAAARYLRYVTGVPADKIHQESLNEDWDRLYELVEASDIICRDEVLDIILTKSWGERKQALQKLAGGKVWRILLDDFFPELRCVRIAIYCEWDPSKPYLESIDYEDVSMEDSEECGTDRIHILKSRTEPVLKPARDTVYIKDTIYYMKETVYMPHDYGSRAYRDPYMKRERPLHDTPWMMGVKTNIIGDALVVPTFGAEIQIAEKLSFDIQGFMTNFNAFNSFDNTANVYGFSPEIRYWPSGRTMRKGQFVGLHARCAWYTLQWKDGLLYQNGPENMWEGNYHNAGNSTPAWSLGFTYGYSLGFGRKGHWGVEFLLGIGYANYRQNIATFNNGIWELVEHQDKHHFGITRAGVNLTYRFSLRKVKPSYYDNN